MGRGHTLLHSCAVEFRVEVIPALFLGLAYTDPQGMSLSVCVMTDSSDLPRDLHSWGAAGDHELVIRDLSSDVKIRRGSADRSELVTKVGVDSFKPVGEIHYRRTAGIHHRRAGINVHHLRGLDRSV